MRQSSFLPPTMFATLTGGSRCTSRTKLFGLLLLLQILFTCHAPAQTVIPKEARLDKGLQVAHYERRGDKSKALHSTFIGESAAPISTNEVLVRKLLMTTFADGDIHKPQLIITAPECNLEIGQDNYRASSTNTIRVCTVATNFVLEGRGFCCTRSNELLVISNSVATRLPKPTTTSSGSRVSAASLAQTAVADSTNYFQIFSDRFELHYASNVVIYSGHVLVLDTNAQMRCDYLQARLNTNRGFSSNTTIEQIVADRNITITTTDQGRAFGDHAVYNLSSSGEKIELTGNARWQDGLRESRADKYQFDFTPEHALKTLRADGSAAFKLPDSEFGATNLATTFPIASTQIQSNHFTELFAEHVTLFCSPLKAIETIVAEEHVVITNQFQQSRATGERAVYTKTNEAFELTGNPLFQVASKGDVRGDVLTVRRIDQSFDAKGHSHLTLRLPNFTEPEGLGLPPAPSSATNHYLVVDSHELHALTNLATFKGDVKARLLHGEQLLSTLESQFLEVQIGSSNWVKSILAKDHVHAEAVPQGSILARNLDCDTLLAEFWPGGNFVRKVDAQGHVHGLQVQAPKNKNDESRTTTLDAGSFITHFETVSNTVVVQNAVAERNVLGTQIKGAMTNMLAGQHVVYTGGTNDQIVITGEPKIQYFGPPPKTGSTNSAASTTVSTNKTAASVLNSQKSDALRPAGVVVSGADSLIWDVKTEKLRGTGPYRIDPIQATNNTTRPKPASTNR